MASEKRSAELAFPPAAAHAMDPMPEQELDSAMIALRKLSTESRKNADVLDALNKRLSVDIATVGIMPDAALRSLGIHLNKDTTEWQRLSTLNDGTIMALRRVSDEVVRVRAASRIRTSAVAEGMRAVRHPPEDPAEYVRTMAECARIESESVAAVLRLVRSIDDHARSTVTAAMTAVACERHERELITGKFATHIASIERHLQSMRVREARPHTLIELSARLMGDWNAPDRTAHDIDSAIEHDAGGRVDASAAPSASARATIGAIRALADATASAHTLDPALRRESDQVQARDDIKDKMSRETDEKGEPSSRTYMEMNAAHKTLDAVRGYAADERALAAVRMIALVNTIMDAFVAVTGEVTRAHDPGDIALIMSAAAERVRFAMDTTVATDPGTTLDLAMRTIVDVANGAPMASPPPLPYAPRDTGIHTRHPTAADDPLVVLK